MTRPLCRPEVPKTTKKQTRMTHKKEEDPFCRTKIKNASAKTHKIIF